MSKIIKTTTLLAAIATLLPVMAGYRVTVPLENDQGGALPKGSIIIGQITENNNGNNDTDTTGKVCTYDMSGSMVTLFKQSYGPFKAGDKGYIYNGVPIGFYSPSNGYSGPPSGVARGQIRDSDPEMDNYEICVDESKTYPPVPMPTGSGDDNENPPYVPPTEEDKTGPDWTPECIFNVNTDYSAYDRVNRQYVMQSSQFGISVISRTWYHVPSDYDPDRAGSYIYLDNSSKTGTSSGSNPDYDYAGICRVKKMEL